MKGKGKIWSENQVFAYGWLFRKSLKSLVKKKQKHVEKMKAIMGWVGLIL